MAMVSTRQCKEMHYWHCLALKSHCHTNYQLFARNSLIESLILTVLFIHFTYLQNKSHTSLIMLSRYSLDVNTLMEFHINSIVWNFCRISCEKETIKTWKMQIEWKKNHRWSQTVEHQKKNQFNQQFYSRIIWRNFT